MVLPFNDEVDAILQSLLPGQRFATAFMNVLMGRVNPSGKLTYTMPNRDHEQGMSKRQYPGVDDIVEYSEGIQFGYRWYD